MRVAITGLGATTPLGSDAASLSANARRGEVGLAPVARFAGTPLEGRVGGAHAEARPRRRGDVALALAEAAAREALRAVGGPTDHRLALVVGTTMAPRERPVADLARELRDALGLHGSPVLVVSTACTSGSAAVAVGEALLAMGAADRVLAGGTDELDLKSFAGFAALRLLATGPCTPFHGEAGTTLGEGAAMFLLEREEDARAAGREALAFLEGHGSSADGYHATSPHPAGDGLVRAAQAALADAGLSPDAVDWISAHGTGTAANDATEAVAIARLFGPRARSIPVTASKSLVGHTLGAAGAVELAIAIEGLRGGYVPPTAFRGPHRPACDLRVVGEALDLPSGHVLKLGSAFGGANAALVIGHPQAPPIPRQGLLRRPVRIAGWGGVGAPAADLDPMGARGDVRGAIEPFAFEERARGIDPRGLDPTSRLLILAVYRALRHAGGPCSPERSGLFVGQRRASPSSTDEFEASIEARGLLGASGAAFTRRVLNTPSGAAARGLALRGPTLTLSTGAGSGLVAVVLAVQHLALRVDADRLVAGGVDELAADEDRTTRGEGAAAVALEASTAGGVHVVSARLTGPGRGDEAALSALAEADLARDAVERFDASDSPGAPALGGVLALGLACARIDGTPGRSALVVEDGELVSAALVLTYRDGGSPRAG